MAVGQTCQLWPIVGIPASQATSPTPELKRNKMPTMYLYKNIQEFSLKNQSFWLLQWQRGTFPSRRCWSSLIGFHHRCRHCCGMTKSDRHPKLWVKVVKVVKVTGCHRWQPKAVATSRRSLTLQMVPPEGRSSPHPGHGQRRLGRSSNSDQLGAFQCSAHVL